MAEGVRLISTALRRVGAANPLARLANRVRIAAKDWADRRQGRFLAKSGATVQVRQDDLLAFYERYEDFVEILCDAAQYGPAPRLEVRYQETRAALAGGYTELKPYVIAFLRPNSPGSAIQDPFESLLLPESVSDFLDSDDGDTIARISLAREALNLYGEHLRQLADRTA